MDLRESLSDVNGTFHFGPTKTYANRLVVLPGMVRDALAQHLEHTVEENDDALVFTSPQGTPLRLPNFRRRVWFPALEAAGLRANVRIHDLRHTAASLLIAQGAHPKAVQAHLGHSSIQVTMDRYGHLFPGDAEGLAEKLDAAARAARDVDRTWTGSKNDVIDIATLERKGRSSSDFAKCPRQDSNLRHQV